MASSEKFGERLIGRLIDEYAANDPRRVWASIPVDNDDRSTGFQDVSYGQFANAINHAAWWLKHQLSTKGSNITTVAYAGPKDLRYPIIAVAVLKFGKKVVINLSFEEVLLNRQQLLLCSPFATIESQNHLLSSTGTSVYFHANELGPLITSVSSKPSSSLSCSSNFNKRYSRDMLSSFRIILRKSCPSYFNFPLEAF